MASLRRPQLPELASLHYRNALLHGRAHPHPHPNGPALVLLSHPHSFLACNSLLDGLHNDYSLFFPSHCRYLYGLWRKGRPEGMTVIRLHQILIITHYSSGQLPPGSSIVVLFEKYNTAVVLQVTTEGWQLREKNEVYCSEQLADLLQQCRFPSQGALPHSLVQYLNRYMVGSEIKLRLINNSFYRYGYDKGLAIIFDDQFAVLSAGWHHRNQLTEMGVRYTPQTVGAVTEEGIFEENTCTYEGDNRPDAKLSRIYNNYHLSAINFRNEFYRDPSLPYFDYFDQLIASPFLRQIFNSLILSKSRQLHPYNPMMLDSSKEDSPKKYQQISLKQYEGHTFKKGEGYRQQPSKESIRSQKREKEIDIIRMNRNQVIDSKEFEKLPHRNRLEILRKELYETVNSRTTPTKIDHDRLNKQLETIEKSRRKSRIINMQPVNIRNLQREKEDKKKSNIYIRELEQQEEEPIASAIRTPNVEKNIDIVLRQEKREERREEKESEDNSRSKSRNRKNKIFDGNKSIRSIKRDYSPDTQVSPFKAKMRARIFQNRTPDRSRSRTPEKSVKNFQRTLADPINPMLLSPHHQLKASRDNKSIGSSRLITYPVTMTKQTKLKEVQQSEGVEEQQVRGVREINRERISAKENLRAKEEERARRDNGVYRKSLMKGDHGNYVYEPITIKEAGNMPYVMNSNFKKPTLSPNSSKKSIGDTSPYKRDKMTAYQPGNSLPRSYF